jgi:hypothetical protein
MNDTTLSVDFVFDTSITCANIPSGYDSYVRIGSILTDSSSYIIQFIQRKDIFLFKTPIYEGETALTASRQLITLSVPPDVNVTSTINFRFQYGTVGYRLLYMCSPDLNDVPPDFDGTPLSSAIAIEGSAGSEYVDYAEFNVLTDTSSRIAVRSDNASCTLRLATLGWRDNLGIIL